MKPIFACLVIAVSFFVQPLLACSCLQEADIETGVPLALQQADAVFLGNVVSVEKDRISEFETYETTVFAVQSKWKGALGATLTTRILTTCCLCGYQFSVGRAYLVYAKQAHNGQYRVSTCSRTKHGDQAKAELRFLRSHD